MYRLITFLFVLFTGAATAQHATFMYDSVELKKYSGSQFSKLRSWEWKINGKLLTLTSGAITIKPHPVKLDTILFRKSQEQKWDTFLTNITRPLSYSFMFNPCCGGFNIMINGKPDGLSSGVVITVNGTGPDLLGTLSETGIFLKPGLNDTLRSRCRSALLPNIFSVTIQEVDRQDTMNLTDSLDCITGDPSLPEDMYGYRYSRKSTPVRFNYIPVGTTLHVIYDARLKKVMIR